MNITALQEVLSSQTLTYAFPFSSFSFPTDISCIVLTEGSKSAFFRTDIVVPFQPTSSGPEDVSRLYKPAADVVLPEPEKIKAFRDWVVGARQGKVHVGEATSEVRRCVPTCWEKEKGLTRWRCSTSNKTLSVTARRTGPSRLTISFGG